MIRELFKKYREQISYLFFGVMTTLVNWVSYYLLAYLVFGGFDIDKSVSKAIAVVLAVIFAFVVNKLFVFESKTNEHLFREIVTFSGARALSSIVEVGGFKIFVDTLGYNDTVVNIAVSVFVVLFNYVLSKFLIFKK